MCIRCHQGISDEALLSQLTEVVDYRIWNDTALSHLYLASTGMNGPAVREEALALLYGYMQWLGPGEKSRSVTANFEKLKALGEVNRDAMRHRILHDHDLPFVPPVPRFP